MYHLTLWHFATHVIRFYSPSFESEHKTSDLGECANTTQHLEQEIAFHRESSLI